LSKFSEGQKLRPPATVLEITRDLEKAGFEVWAVGGAVRDALLGQGHLDWDLATNATPDQVRTVFGRRRTIPVGVEFGTVGVLDKNGVLHEVTTFRRDVRTDGRHAEVEFGVSLDEDLARRDFTINAIAYSPTREHLRDPFGGRKDLAGKLVRAVGEPADRMREDRLRALRAIRFAARLGFALDTATWEAIRASAPHLTRLSAERVKQELEKTMEQVTHPSRALRLWRESGALEVLIPELTATSAEVFAAVDHAKQPGVPRRPGRRLTRIAVLFSEVPAARATALALRLRFSKNDSQWIAALAERWQTVGVEMQAVLGSNRDADAAQVRRWIAGIGRPLLPAFFRLAQARWEASGAGGSAGIPAAQAVHSLYRRSLRAALTEPVDLRDLAVDGDDLRQAGIAPGPGLGKILSSLLGLVLADPATNTRDRLLAEAQRLNAAATMSRELSQGG
jgi:tRNA nucleotidyltransferase (CCA-adding enzyme)